MNEPELIKRLLSRDETALIELEAAYGPRLGAIAANVTGDPHYAEECVSTALYKAWEKADLIRPGHMFGFLAKAVRGEAIDRMRREKSQKRSAVLIELTRELEECLPGNADAESEAEARELGRAIRGFVTELPSEKQLIFVRRYWYFDTVAQIAESMGITESKVKTELCRARKKLARRLKEEGYTL